MLKLEILPGPSSSVTLEDAKHLVSTVHVNPNTQHTYSAADSSTAHQSGNNRAGGRVSPLSQRPMAVSSRLVAPAGKTPAAVLDVLRCTFPAESLEKYARQLDVEQGALGKQMTTSTKGSTLIISTQPATRLDVVTLQDVLDAQLIQREVQDNGICAIRSSVYDELFDELLRQVIIDCPERGGLLARIREESRMSLKCHKAKYEGSMEYSVSSVRSANDGTEEVHRRVTNLTEQCKDLRKQVEVWKSKSETMERQEQDRRQQEDRRHQEELKYLTSTNQQLSQYLKTILEANAKK